MSVLTLDQAVQQALQLAPDNAQLHLQHAGERK